MPLLAATTARAGLGLLHSRRFGKPRVPPFRHAGCCWQLQRGGGGSAAACAISAPSGPPPAAAAAVRRQLRLGCSSPFRGGDGRAAASSCAGSVSWRRAGRRWLAGSRHRRHGPRRSSRRVVGHASRQRAAWAAGGCGHDSSHGLRRDGGAAGAVPVANSSVAQAAMSRMFGSVQLEPSAALCTAGAAGAADAS